MRRRKGIRQLKESMGELTETQRRVMTFIGKSWYVRRSHGSAIEMNGKRVCNIDTAMNLSSKMGRR
jgi:prefoldin subunit 5